MDIARFSPILQQIFNWLKNNNLLDALIFLSLLSLILIISRYTPAIIRFIIYRLAPIQSRASYGRWIKPIEPEMRVTGTVLLVGWSLEWLVQYQAVYRFIKPLVDFVLIASLAWLISRLFNILIQAYGINFVQKAGLEPDELILPLEAIINILIGLIAAITFAQSQDVNLIGVVASLGVAATAVGFAAQSALSQVIGTIVLYLDRPFIKGEYVRLPSGLFGRVESIGLRSTKIRTAGKSTLVIVPNSSMANYDIENVTRGKKVMVLLNLDFRRVLAMSEQALVQGMVTEATNALNGVDPGSTRINLSEQDELPGTRARVTFFILGSTENSLQLRKRMLELANETIAQQLKEQGLEFTAKEPTVYVDSPVPI